VVSKIQNLIVKSRKNAYPRNIKIITRTQNKNLFNISLGPAVKFYDVGSMTKIMVTVPLCMKLYEEKKLNLNAKVETYLKYFQKTPIGRIQIKNLLRHDSGLVAWKPFYKTLKKLPENDRVNALKVIFQREKVKKTKKCIYSDLDFIILGWVIEETLDMALDEAAQIFIFDKLEMKNTFFNPKKRNIRLGAATNGKNFAPTRKNRERGLVQGEVFDENSWGMGGVSGHAGLFSTGEDVTKMGQVFLELYQGKVSLVKPATFKKFIKRAVPSKKGDWGLGFTLPSRPVSTAGTKVSLKAFGHVGYTGTSLWIDPTRKSVVTILSNGTYPTYTNEKFKYLRRELHDLIWEIIDGQI
jgi:CubicO group peptidase (beta-lactamase class C family)